MQTCRIQCNLYYILALAGKSSEGGNEQRSSANNSSGLPNNISSTGTRRQRLDDSGNDSGHNSIMTSK